MRTLKIAGLLTCVAILFFGGILVYIEQKQQNLRSPDRPLTSPLTEGEVVLSEDKNAETAKKLEMEHPHENESGTLAENTAVNYDWQQDEIHEGENAPSTDPWAEYFQARKDNEVNVKNSEDHETNPYPNWYESTDPYIFTEGHRWSLIRQFGDIPEVHIFADTEFKIRSKIPYSIDEKIRFLEAMNSLWPNESTQRGLAEAKAWKASGKPFITRYGSTEPRDQFLDVKPFVEQHGWEEGIRQFRKINPQRAAEFERVIGYSK